MITPPDENKLIVDQALSGNTKAFSKLYQLYSSALYGVIIRICKDEGVAQEVLQETFLTIWQKGNTFDPEKGKFFTWAYRIAKNKSLNKVRSANNLIQTEDLSVYNNKEATTYDNSIDYKKLTGAISKLDQHHQIALELVYFEGLTHREAHKKMGVPLGSFKSYIQQALKKLRDVYGTNALTLVLLFECFFK